MRLFRTLAFRLTALYVLLFAASVIVLFAIVWFATQRAMRDRVSSSVEREAVSLADELRATNAATAAFLIERRLRRGHIGFYLLQDRNGRFIAGNITPIRPVVGQFTGRVHLTAELEPTQPPAPGEVRDVLGFGILLSDGTFVLAADDVERVWSTHRASLTAFTTAGAISILLAIAGGLLLSRGFLRRIDAVNRTTAEIVAGRLSSRIPARADGNEIDELACNLNSMLDRIQGLMENLKQVLNDVAHDLRTPLSRLHQSLEIARNSASTVSEYRESITSAIHEVEQILETFSALLRIAQIESGSRKAGFARIDLSELLGFAAETFQPVAEDAEHRLSFSIEPGISMTGDRELLLQMATNLIENAIRHTPAGSSIDLTLKRDGADVVLTCTDNGPGIPAGERKKVLQRFYRLETSRTTPGSGLGLALVSAVADLHGATITLSDRRPGLQVEIRFPAC